MFIFSAVVHRVCLFGGFGYILKNQSRAIVRNGILLDYKEKKISHVNATQTSTSFPPQGENNRCPRRLQRELKISVCMTTCTVGASFNVDGGPSFYLTPTLPFSLFSHDSNSEASKRRFNYSVNLRTT